MNIYLLIRETIKNGVSDKEALRIKLDAFYFYNRLTKEQYEELLELLV